VTFVRPTKENAAARADFVSMIPHYMRELDVNACREFHPEWAEKWAYSMLEKLSEDGRQLEVCYEVGVPLGFFYGKKDKIGQRGEIRPGWGYVMEFYVLPEYRRRGHGREMYARLEELFRRDGITQLWLTSDPVTGRAFWPSVGFCGSGEVSDENGLEIYEKNI